MVTKDEMLVAHVVDFERLQKYMVRVWEWDRQSDRSLEE